MEWLSLELKLISCRDLKAFNFFQKLAVYAVVSVFNENDEVKKTKKQQQRQKTKVDREGGSRPEWNHTMQFDLKPISIPERGDHLFLKFELRCEGVIFGKKTIGEVCVPFKDLIDEFNGTVRFVSYQIRNSDGKPNGVLNFSYRVNGKARSNRADSPKPDKPSGAHFSPKKVQLEVNVQSRETCLYPSLDDICSPLPSPSSKTSVAPTEFYHPVKAFYTMSPPPFTPQLPVLAVGHETYYHQYPLPVAQSPGPYWYTTERTAYGCGLYG